MEDSVKQKIEFSYEVDGIASNYNMQLSQDEFNVLNSSMLKNHGKVDVVITAIKELFNNEACTKYHKMKINEMLSKTNVINFRLIQA